MHGSSVEISVLVLVLLTVLNLACEQNTACSVCLGVGESGWRNFGQKESRKEGREEGRKENKEGRVWRLCCIFDSMRAVAGIRLRRGRPALLRQGTREADRDRFSVKYVWPLRLVVRVSAWAWDESLPVSLSRYLVSVSRLGVKGRMQKFPVLRCMA
jgi:hypothetical protein